MIRALVVLNEDGRLVRRSILGLPEKVFLHSGIQELCGDSLIMYTMLQIPNGEPPMKLGDISCKSLVAENEDKLASMAANLVVKEEVGDITILANRSTLDAMDYIGMAYELDVLYSCSITDLPLIITEGRTQVDCDIVDEDYILRRYQQTVTNATDSQIADAIAGMETFFNEQDKMNDNDRSAVNKIANSVAKLNAAIRRSRLKSDLDSYDDGNESDISDEPDLDDELDSLWDAQTEMARQIGNTIEMVNNTQDKLMSVLSSMDRKAELDRNLVDRVNMINGRVDRTDEALDGLRNQLGNTISEFLTKNKSKTPAILYVLLGLSLVMNLINLLL